jgi:hypothetical protein
VHKAHYVLMNIECDQEALDELESAFRFNDAVLRNLIIKRDRAVTDASPLLKGEDEDERGERRAAGRRRTTIVASDVRDGTTTATTWRAPRASRRSRPWKRRRRLAPPPR